ncbi:phospholipid/cholesterol/gamma-HCH transport system substrate-binding protein [Nocardioides luteus]|uniref:ABC transporter substrate-binding protein n=1 Tax=Nocardioides luteus TaxID=1844 RepID=A0ABQ5SY96_9ACTN|nr:MCE family protein [Nocardioides luteus]MDR7313541.1 phospholipid/cholesterol/gamma-HCH transport system substrate-binding protein [Nocardioides luteus]GGR68712.1 ABC transporter substrate-binding protein [Nocardioides luteus]GLJ69163.1 ABC transporter substrate-binding protein [Nocardioides luteus]
MIPFRERNPVKIGAVSIAVLAMLVVMAFKADSLPLIGGGTTYYANFSEAGGLKAGDEVRVAGVRVGKVDSIELDGNKVKVAFKIREKVRFGETSAAGVRVKTLLGDMFLELQPGGEGQMKAGATIPVDRTESPYDVVEAFEGLADTSANIDKDQLAAALTTLADLTRSTPEEFQAALTGVSDLSRNLAAKDERIESLLTQLDRVTKVLDERDDDLITLMNNANQLFAALVERREAVHNLLVSTQQLSKELSKLVDDSRADLKPALESLDVILDVFTKNEENLEKSLKLMAPFYKVFNNTLGNGPWWDTYIQNMPPVPALTGGKTP